VVRNAIIGCLDGVRELYFDFDYGEVIVKGDSFWQPFSNLSDGLGCMLATVGDIAMKAAMLNPHLGADVLKETPGVALIDELDLHLHPKWQRHVIEDLRRTFPKIQFFATTHSPQIVGETQPESLILLRNERGRIISDKGRQAYGLDSNYVLEFIMDAPSRSIPASEALDSVEEALEDGRLDDARKALDELRSLLHGEAPDVVRLEATINTLEVLADETYSEAD
jgi:predicted ATP-binding protein involved in virulence